MSASGSDARRSLRVKPRTPVPLVDVMWDRVLGFVLDLSAGGMKVLASRELADEGLYQVQFDLDTEASERERIEAGVQVVSQSPGAGGMVAGMRFIHLPKVDSRALAQWLERQAH